MSAKPFGFRRARATFVDVLVLALCVIGIAQRSFAHEWRPAFHSLAFLAIYWGWSFCRRETEAWEHWYSGTTRRVRS